MATYWVVTMAGSRISPKFHSRTERARWIQEHKDGRLLILDDGTICKEWSTWSMDQLDQLRNEQEGIIP